MAANVPTEEDWGDWSIDPDTKHAHALFAGKTNHDMGSHFRSNVIERSADLAWMPAIAFRYYMLGFRDYIMSGDFDPLWMSDSASCYLRLIEEKLRKQPGDIVPIMAELMPSIEHVAHNQGAYNASLEIYGDFRELLATIRDLHGNA